MGLSEAESQGLVAAVGGEAEVADRVARSALDYELEDPGFLVRQLARLPHFDLRSAGLTAGGVSLALTVYSLALDIADLNAVEDRIKNKAWSEAAQNIEKVRIRMEWQLTQLIQLRATFDLSTFDKAILVAALSNVNKSGS